MFSLQRGERLSLRTRQGEAIHSSVHVILLRRQKLDYFVAKLLVMTGCHVQPAQKVMAIQGQIGKEVQNDKTNSPLLAGQGELLIKEHLSPRPLRERVRVRGDIISAGCHVLPDKEVIAILQGQIGKEVQNDGKISLSHVVVKRSVLKKEPPIAFLKLTPFAKNCGFPIGETVVLFPLLAGEATKWQGKGEVSNLIYPSK